MTVNSIRTYLDADLRREVARIARAQGRSESSLIAESVRLRFASESAHVKNVAAESQRRQINRMEARIDRLQRDQAFTREMVAVFVRVWLEHNPPLNDDEVDSAAASAEARFERFLDLVAQGLTPGRSMSDALFDLAALNDARDHDNASDAEHGASGGTS